MLFGEFFLSCDFCLKKLTLFSKSAEFLRIVFIHYCCHKKTGNFNPHPSLATLLKGLQKLPLTRDLISEDYCKALTDTTYQTPLQQLKQYFHIRTQLEITPNLMDSHFFLSTSPIPVCYKNKKNYLGCKT